MLVVEVTAECRCIMHSFLFWSHICLASAAPEPEAHSQLAPLCGGQGGAGQEGANLLPRSSTV